MVGNDFKDSNLKINVAIKVKENNNKLAAES